MSALIHKTVNFFLLVHDWFVKHILPFTLQKVAKIKTHTVIYITATYAIISDFSSELLCGFTEGY